MREPIKSKSNQHLKEVRSLRERKHRDRTSLFTAEGEDLLAEAQRFGVSPRAVLYDAERVVADDPIVSAHPGALPVTSEALESASALGSGSRVIGVFEQRWAELGPESPPPSELDAAIYLHDVADPGNVGAVLRSALALTRAIVFLSASSADPFGPKAVRASMGAVFGQSIARAGLAEARATLGEGWQVVALAPRRGKPLPALELGRRTLFCLGSERAGLPDELAAACDDVAHVPLRSEGFESLNVAMAATLCLYEASTAAAASRRSL